MESGQTQGVCRKVAGKLNLGIGNRQARKELRRDNQLDQFFANNPEYGREFFDLGAKGFADKYQNDLGFGKNFPTTEDKELFKKELKELKQGARRELADLLVYRTDENSDKANLEFLDMGERFKMLSLLYTNQAGGEQPLIASGDFSNAMRTLAHQVPHRWLEYLGSIMRLRSQICLQYVLLSG